MNQLKIISNIQKHISLTDIEQQLFISMIKVKHTERKAFILKQGQVSKKFFFVEEGSLRAFNINLAGKESTIMFAVQDWWITDMMSFVNQKPALLSIEAIEDSVIVELDYDKYIKLLEQIPKFEKAFRILFQNAYIREQGRILDNISMTTEQRYLRFVGKYPQIVEKVTQKQIASYLGVTPEFLSTIKQQIS